MKQKIEGGWTVLDEEFDDKFHSKIEHGGKCECENIKKFIRFQIEKSKASERQRCVGETEKVIWDKLPQPMASIVVGIIRDSQSIHN